MARGRCKGGEGDFILVFPLAVEGGVLREDEDFFPFLGGTIDGVCGGLRFVGDMLTDT